MYADEADPEIHDEREQARILAKYQDLYATDPNSPDGAQGFGQLDEYHSLEMELALLRQLDQLVDPAEPPAEQFGEFEVIGEIGRGGMGIVYEALQLSLNRRVALKVMHPFLASEPRALERFLRESRTLAKLPHPNIVTVYAAGIEARAPFLAMELVHGATLSKLMRQARLELVSSSVETRAAGQKEEWLTKTPLAVEATSEDMDAAIEAAADGLTDWHPPPPPGFMDTSYWTDLATAFAGAAEGLQYVHSQKVFHRDVKPSNLILDQAGHLRIIDFGLAKVSGETSLTPNSGRVGTLLYMSPEQVSGKSEVEAAGDIYGLGAALYEMLTWRPPAQGRTDQQISHSILERDPPSPRSLNRAVPKDLETIVLKCLRKKPEHRYGSAEALAQDLRRFSRDESIEARPEAWTEAVKRRMWQRRALLTQCAAILCLLVMIGTAVLHGYEERTKKNVERYNDLVSQGEMSFFDAQNLVGPRPLVSMASASPVSVVHPQDAVPPGSGQIGKKIMGTGISPLVVSPRLPRPGPEPLKEAVKAFELAIEERPGEPLAYYRLARALIFSGDLDRGGKRLEQVLELDPGFLPAMDLMAWLSERSDPKRAAALRTEVERQVQVKGARWSLVWLEATRAVLEKRWEEAERLFDSIDPQASADGELYSGHAIDALLERGVTRLKARRPIEALPDFGEAKRVLKGRIEPGLLIVKAYFLAGQKRAAERELEFLRESVATRTELADRVALEATSIFREQGDSGAAIEWIGRISKQLETTRLLLAADVYALQGEDEKALDAARKAYEREPGSLEACLALGNAFYGKGQPLEASNWYRLARDIAPEDPRPDLSLAICAGHGGRLEDQQQALLEVVRRKRGHASAHAELGRVRTLLGDLEGALASCSRAVELDPGDAIATNNLGVIQDRLKDRVRARQSYEKAIRLEPGFAAARYNLGWLFHRERCYREARDEYQAAIALGLDDGLVYSNLGPCLDFLHDVKGAIDAYEKALDRGFTKDSAMYQNYATALFKDGQLSRAAKNYERAIALESRDYHSRYYLGLVLEKLKRPEEAVLAYRGAVDMATEVGVDPTFQSARVNLASLLLRLALPAPEGEALVAEITRLEGVEADQRPGVISWLLEDYRRAHAPRMATYASIDSLFAGPFPFEPSSIRWRFQWSGVDIARDWVKAEFPDESWSEGGDRFGLPGSPELPAGTDIGSAERTALRVRAAFEVPDPGLLGQLLVRVRSTAAFTLYVNGLEVFRDGQQEGQDVAATPGAYDAARIEEIPVELGKLNSGLNVVALLALPVPDAMDSFLFSVRLETAATTATEVRERARAAFEQLPAPDVGTKAEALKFYLAGRLRALEGSPARTWFEEAIERDPGRPEPYLRLAAEYERENDLGGAEEAIQAALEAGLARHDSLWDEWLRLKFIHAAQDVGDVLAAYRALTAATSPVTRRQKDMGWLLEKLAREEPLRIRCGGKDGWVQEVEWSHDRFFLAGEQYYLDKLAGKEDVEPLLDMTERYFPGWSPLIRGYSIPLRPGTYEVILRITEGYHEEPGDRQFDVLLEREQVCIPGYSSRFGVAEVHSCTVNVIDGVLDIDFRRRKGDPKLSALEIRAVE